MAPSQDGLTEPLKPPTGSGTASQQKRGFAASRSCTDCPALLFLILVWCAFGYFLNIIYTTGNPDRLLFGTDYLGNVCGVGSPNVSVKDWSNRTYLWYPVTYDFAQKKLLIDEAFSLGVCVSSCPSVADIVRPYGAVNTTSSVVGGHNNNTFAMPPFWPVLFTSSPQFYRCVPNFFTFNCQGSSACVEDLLQSNSTFAAAAQLTAYTNGAVDELRTGYPMILIGIGICVGLSFFWLVILRFIVKPVAVITMLLVLVALAGLGYLLWWQHSVKLAENPPSTDTAQYFFYGAIIAWIIALLYLCVLVFIWSDVMIAYDVIEEATHVPTTIPTMIFVPILSFVSVVPFVVLALATAIYIQSCGDVLEATLPTPSFVNTSDPYSSVRAEFALTNLSLAGFESQAQSANITTRTYEFKNWRNYGHAANIFMFLWSFGLINAIGFMIVALCAVSWYFSGPGDSKNPPIGAVGRAALLTFRYHLGTLAFGSLLVAIVQLVRIGVCFLEHKLRQAGLDDKKTKYLIACVQCLLACLERVIKFVNKNAYISCAMTGKSFFPAAMYAIDLLKANALSVGAVNVIGEYVMTFGKVLVTCATIVASHFAIAAMHYDGGATQGMVLLFVIAVVGFLIACLFTVVFSVCIDTVLLCFCEDKGGCEDPVFCPLALKAHIANAARRAQLKRAAEAGAAGVLSPPTAHGAEPRAPSKELDVL